MKIPSAIVLWLAVATAFALLIAAWSATIRLSSQLDTHRLSPIEEQSLLKKASRNQQ